MVVSFNHSRQNNMLQNIQNGNISLEYFTLHQYIKINDTFVLAYFFHDKIAV